MSLHSLFVQCKTNLVEVERRQVIPTRGLLLGVAALLQGFVFGQEETHPGAGGGGGVLAGEQEADQHPRNLVIVQGPAVPGEEENILKLVIMF